MSLKEKVLVPQAGESVSEADVVLWHKADSDYVERDDVLVDIETEKATLSVSAQASGILKILVKEGETVQVGQTIGEIDIAKQKSSSDKKENITKKVVLPKEEKTLKMNAETRSDALLPSSPSPAAGKMMRQKKLDASEILPTGKGGRITKQDVLLSLEKKLESGQEDSLLEMNHKKNDARGMRREKMSRLRKTIASRLKDAQKDAALLTTFNEIDMSALMEIRNKYKENFKEKYGVKLGFISFFALACARALKAFPVLNAFVEGEEIVYHDYVDIGIAVATDKGLVVPVIRNVESMRFDVVEKSIASLAERAKSQVLEMEEMEGGTFSITNGGTFGSMLSTPIVNKPQSAILGLHNIVERPVVNDGKIEVASVMYVALTYDHRIIDGSDAVRFLVNIKNQIEDPTRLLLGV